MVDSTMIVISFLETKTTNSNYLLDGISDTTFYYQ